MKANVVILKIIIHLACLCPLGYYYFLAITDQFGADPVEAIIHFTGISSLNLLLLTLSVSPLAKLLQQGRLIRTRRLLGLYAALFALLHVMNFFLFELQLDLSLFVGEVIERPYITVGMLAFIFINMLAVTSWSKIRRAMGKRWQTLHNLNYLLTLLVGIHFYWSVKSETIEPSIYLAIIFLLLLWRKNKFQRWLS
ncbi:protein-methionine-sulfoxide reductase heme-binding subunit MsrQ [Thalassotalea maritima]|uniref:protein-methionine-sulfoxide reductase heme-binding subunit MsrQ n=1 Tax=Thalassotalea maritima TaxID=3242416 RepID=UPI00352807D5